MPKIVREFTEQFELLNEWLDQAELVCQNPGLLSNIDPCFKKKWQDFLTCLKTNLRTLDQILRSFDKFTDNKMLQGVLRDKAGCLFMELSKYDNTLRKEAGCVEPAMDALHLNVITGQLDELMIISKRDPTLLARYNNRCASFTNQLVILKQNLSQLERSPDTISIFIWHSQQGVFHIDRPLVIKLAQHLQMAGFDVKLDITTKITCTSTFRDNIDGRDKTQFILVFCTPDVPLLDQADPLSNDLARIQYRHRKAGKTQETNCILPVILRGSHEMSVPAFLQTRATDNLNVSNRATYASAFFNLIQALYGHDEQVVKLTRQAYAAYIEQTSPELEKSQPDTSYAASSSITSPVASADTKPIAHWPHASPELEEEPSDMDGMTASCSDDYSWPGSSTGTTSSSSGFFYHPSSMAIKPPSEGQNLSIRR